MKYAERIAREVYGLTMSSGTKSEKRKCVDIICEILGAIAATGCKIVVREPTEEMLDEHYAVRSPGPDEWRAMFDAAPYWPEDEA